MQIPKARGVVPEWHALTTHLDHLEMSCCEVYLLHFDCVSIQVGERARPAQQRLFQADGQVGVEVVPVALELGVLPCLELQDHAAWQHAWPLLGHAREGEGVPAGHPLLNVHIQRGIHLFAFLLAGHFLLLLGEEGSHLNLHHLDLVLTSSAALAVGGVWVLAAAPAHNAPLYHGLKLVPQIEVLQSHLDLGVQVPGGLDLPLLRVLHRAHAACVVEDLLIGVIEDLIGIADLRESRLGCLIRVLIWMVLNGQLSVDLLDGGLIGILRDAQHFVEVLVQVYSLVVIDAVEAQR
mmetsp:Transcript_28602/g.68025  ORF Transcript_28602/g.68025 Transcript_28602/m.68025 type:complete len:293 (-) Transcript_28602:514-1392(-)